MICAAVGPRNSTVTILWPNQSMSLVRFGASRNEGTKIERCRKLLVLSYFQHAYLDVTDKRTVYPLKIPKEEILTKDAYHQLLILFEIVSVPAKSALVGKALMEKSFTGCSDKQC